MQQLFFKVEDMNHSGVFNNVMLLAKQHGVEFNSSDAKRTQ